MKKNDLIKLKIANITSEGSGVAKTESGFTVFVFGAAVGDVVLARIIKLKKNYAIGKIEEIITPSENRVVPDCPYFFKCGGCVYKHITYEEELKIKEQQVCDALRRIGKITDAKINSIVKADFEERYRNKAQIPIGIDNNNNITMGYYAFHSHRIINSEDCKLHPEVFSKITKTAKAFFAEKQISIYNENNHTGILRHFFIRYGKNTNEIMVCVVINGRDLPHKNEFVKILTENFADIKSIIINVNTNKTNVILGDKSKVIFGRDYITDELCDCLFKLSLFSFYQINHSQTEKLYKIAQDYANLSKNKILLDLYCGVGTIGLTMAKDCKQLIGVEVVPSAVENAIENAKLNNTTNAEFICADAANAALDMKERGLKPDVIIIDPPRKGCSADLIKTVSEFEPERVVYVSCDSATLARDLNIFKEYGYIVQELTPVDLFPKTAHVECVVLISKVD